MRKIFPHEITQMRKDAGLNQATFWSKVFLTQSAGSRYEKSGNDVSNQTNALLILAYGSKAEAEALYQELRKGQDDEKKTAA